MQFATNGKKMADKFEDVEREVGQDVHAAFEMLARQLGTVECACRLCSSRRERHACRDSSF